MIDVILITTVVALCYYLWRQTSKKLNYFKDRNIPHHKGYPVVGSMGRLFFKQENIADFFMRICEDFRDKPMFGMFGLMGPQYVVQDPEMIKQIGIKDIDKFINRPQNFISEHKADTIIAKSLLGLRDDKWKNMRANLSPTFTSSKMKIMFDLVRDSTDDLTKYCRENLRSDGTMEIATKEIFSKVAINAIATTAMGIKVDSLREPENDVYVAAMDILKHMMNNQSAMFFISWFPKLATWCNISMIHQKSSEFFKRLVNETIEQRQKNKIYRPDVIQLLMTEIAKMTNDELTAQAFLFFFGGFEPVSTFLQFAFYELALNDDCQQRLYEEIMEVKQKLNGKPIDYETLNNMEYLEAFINEVLRKKSGFMIERVCNADTVVTDSDGNKHKIEKGAGVMFPAFRLHYEQRYFPNPEKFDPTRFMGDKKKDAGIAFMPFGMGLRNCIGLRFAYMESKIVMYSILSEFVVQPNQKTLIPFRWKKGMTNLPEKPLIVELKKR